MKAEIQKALSESLESIKKNIGGIDAVKDIEIDVPRKKEFGDYSTNLAMILAPQLKKNPRDVASLVIDNLPSSVGNLFTKIEIMGPGFVNFFVNPVYIVSKLEDIHKSGESYGFSDIGGGKKALLEFVSANPTGNLHIGHARNAAVGDTLANILAAVGYEVTKEYYINDAGNQIDMLAASVYARYKQSLGIEAEMPEDGYQGDYIKGIAGEIKAIKGNGLLTDNGDESESLDYCKDFAKTKLLDVIKTELDTFGVTFENWYSEKKEIHGSDGENDGHNKLESIKDELARRGATYEGDGALWFRAKDYGESQDWVLVKKDGRPTYFLADIAYHFDKIERGYERLINIWGADHHGHIGRLNAAFRSLGMDDNALEVLLIQFVRLIRNGEEVKMSKRTGSYVTMGEVVEEVGKDVARFFLLMRSTDSHLDFDLDLAKKESSENPVYYIQYANARINSVYRKAQLNGLKPSPDNLALLDQPNEVELVKKLLLYPETIEDSAQLLSPHKVVFYLQDIASTFHIYYNKNRIVGEDVKLSEARLYLIDCVRMVIHNGLRLLGISIPERM